MNFYQANLAILVVANACFSLYRHRPRNHKPCHRDTQEDGPKEVIAVRFQRQFLLVYTLVVAADWLQGPYTYAVYKYEKQLTEQTVALLYAFGFVSGAVSAPFAGQLADYYGRRTACVAYCVCYGITCLAMLSYNIKILYVGRFFGGIATTLLFSVFEAWMITEYHLSRLEETKVSLCTVFASMTTISSVTAVCSGVLGDGLVQYCDSSLAPFLASLGCCIGASILILATWRENYGSTETCKGSSEAQTLKYRMLVALTNPQVAALVFASCCFEGAMYLFVFFWPAALKSARIKSGYQDDLPLGLIFSSFMCAMMAGSSISTTRNALFSNGITMDTLSFIFVIASAAFAVSTMLGHEHLLFWAFCVIEGCVGIYFPKMALIKSNVVDDSVRGGVYSTLRLPLNIFVVVVHSLDRDGKSP
ncbi:hypothetical protein LI328DRAFT_172065 [Trichoderma asperelloides]|nr:hypothetical protein LI328DRAFT_172065 [Trichoderma asperelloides]